MLDEYCIVCEGLIDDMHTAVEVNDGPDGVAYVCADCWANRPDAPPQWAGVLAGEWDEVRGQPCETTFCGLMTLPDDAFIHDDDNEPY